MMGKLKRIAMKIIPLKFLQSAALFLLLKSKQTHSAEEKLLRAVRSTRASDYLVKH